MAIYQPNFNILESKPIKISRGIRIWHFNNDPIKLLLREWYRLLMFELPISILQSKHCFDIKRLLIPHFAVNINKSNHQRRIPHFLAFVIILFFALVSRPATVIKPANQSKIASVRALITTKRYTLRRSIILIIIWEMPQSFILDLVQHRGPNITPTVHLTSFGKKRLLPCHK